MSFFLRRGEVLDGPLEPAELPSRFKPGSLVAAEPQGPFEEPADLFGPCTSAGQKLAEALELPPPSLTGPGKVAIAWVVALDLVSALAIGAGLGRAASAATSVVLALLASAALLAFGHRIAQPFAALASIAVAVQSVAAGGGGAKWWALAHGLAAVQSVALWAVLALRSRRLLVAIGAPRRSILARLVSRRADGANGPAPPLVGIAAATVSAYALYLGVVYLYHQSAFPEREVEPSLVVYGTGPLALAVRASLYVILLAASLWLLSATHSLGGLGLSLPRGRVLARALGQAALLYFAVFLGLTAADAIVGLVARAGPGAVSAFHDAIGTEARRSAAAPVTLGILLYAGLLGPFAEEIVFRGVLFRALRAHLPVAVAIVLSALAFALLHPYRAAIYQVALVGVLSAWVYDRTGSLWPSILAHAAWNTMLTLQAAPA